MNPHVIRESLRSKKGARVKVKVYGMRNKTDSFIGTIEEIYPEIFTIKTNNLTKSFSYSELISKEVDISFI